jgi:lipopolysaccharide heptosyltransferase II
VNVLILKPSSLGDVVQALPVLRLIKQAKPHAHIYWWLNADLLPLLDGDPDLAGIFTFDRRGWKSLRGWRDNFRSIGAMRALRFDWVIDLQSLSRSGAFAWLADGRLTIGLDSGREGAAGFYDIAVPRPAPDAHAVDWYLSVLPRLGVPADAPFDWLPHREQPADKTLATDAARWVVIVPGARWENKRWPAAAFAEVVRGLSQKIPGVRFAILGGAVDAHAAKIISAANPAACRNLVGHTALPEMLAWVRRAALVITNDTGPMHIAAALRKPIIALFGPTDPARTGPYRQPGSVLRHPLRCSPCLKSTCSHHPLLECLAAIPPAAVIKRAEKILGA